MPDFPPHVLIFNSQNEMKTFEAKLQRLTASEKEWQCGHIILNDGFMWLKDERGITLRKGGTGKEIIESIESCKSLNNCGGKPAKHNIQSDCLFLLYSIT